MSDLVERALALMNPGEISVAHRPEEPPLPMLASETSPSGPGQGLEVVIIEDTEGLIRMEKEICAYSPQKLFIDTETSGLDPYSADLVLIQILANGTTYLVRPDLIGYGSSDDRPGWREIESILTDPSITKIFHNAKFDVKFLKHRLFDGTGPTIQNLFDTYIAEALLTAGRPNRDGNSLAALSMKYTGQGISKDEQTSFRPGAPLSPEQIQYAVRDVQILESLFRKQVKLLRQEGLVRTALLEFSIVPAIADIELAGILIDRGKLEAMRKECEERLNGLNMALSEQVQGIALPKMKSQPKKQGFNPNSSKQVKHVLAQLGIRVDSTAKEELEKSDHPFARLMVEHRRTAKLISSFLKSLPTRIHSDGRIRPEFLQTGAEGGRFSCQKPNLQQIPKEQEWRDLFVAPPGYKIITADYSQIELRILAEYSQDPALIEVFRDGQDLHTRTISNMLKVPQDEVTKEQRQIAKTINFGLCYGMSASGLARELNISVPEAEGFISSYFRAYPQVNRTLQELGMRAVNKGLSETLLGRKRYYKRTDSLGEHRSLERKGRNTPIQGTCADILKKAIQYLMDGLSPFNAKIIHLVHDEIVLEVEESQAEQVKEVVQKEMVRAGSDLIKSVPIEVEAIVDNVWRK